MQGIPTGCTIFPFEDYNGVSPVILKALLLDVAEKNLRTPVHPCKNLQCTSTFLKALQTELWKYVHTVYRDSGILRTGSKIHCCMKCPQILRGKTSSEKYTVISLKIQWKVFAEGNAFRKCQQIILPLIIINATIFRGQN